MNFTKLNMDKALRIDIDINIKFQFIGNFRNSQHKDIQHLGKMIIRIA